MDSTLPEGEKGNIILSVLDGLTMKIIRRPAGEGVGFPRRVQVQISHLNTSPSRR